MNVLRVHNQTGHALSNRPQYFAPSYILWIEIFLVQKNAGKSRTFSPQMEAGFQIHCGTSLLEENMDTVPTSYIYLIRLTSHNKWAVVNQIVIVSPNQPSRFRPMHQLPSGTEQGTSTRYSKVYGRQWDTISIPICYGEQGTIPTVEQAIRRTSTWDSLENSVDLQSADFTFRATLFNDPWAT